MTLFKIFTFDSAHFLPHVPEGHKCKNVHGHTYRLTVHLEAPLEEHLCWVMDFADVKKVVKPIINQVDHKLLNDIEGLENPTCEILAQWLWEKIKPEIPILNKIELWETPASGCVYNGR